MFFLGRVIFAKVFIIYMFVYALKNSYRIKTLLLRFLLPAGVVLIVGTNLLGRTSPNAEDNKAMAAVVHMASYASSSIIVFDMYTQEKNTKRYYGYATLYPFYLQASKLIGAEPPDFYALSKFIKGCNTYTMFRCFYDDFGWAGFFFFAFVFHYVLAYFSFCPRYKASLYAFVYHLMLYPVALFSIQVFSFATTTYCYAFFVCGGVILLVQRKGKLMLKGL
jgi:oligosaccharide repeat unit polymerase